MINDSSNSYVPRTCTRTPSCTYSGTTDTSSSIASASGAGRPSAAGGLRSRVDAMLHPVDTSWLASTANDSVSAAAEVRLSALAVRRTSSMHAPFTPSSEDPGV